MTMNTAWYNNRFILTMCVHMQISSFIHSGYINSASSSPLLLRGAPHYSIDTVSEFHAEALQAIASERLAQGPYVAARVGFEPATLLTPDAEHITKPPRPKNESELSDVRVNSHI